MKELSFKVRVRDLVHGQVYLTAPEVAVIDHPLFQRLRHVRQNDVAAFVYPSMNTSRFEHSLGCASVAGRMALNITRGQAWRNYRSAVDLDEVSFQQACRLYALLHDVGHLPLSHLFEHAFRDSVEGRNVKLQQACREWFGVDGFEKLHEAAGARIAQEILADIRGLPRRMMTAVLDLLQTKKLPPSDPRAPMKHLIDSEIDADRIDSTARDGLLAGREYGGYDIERLCSSVFVCKFGTDWKLVYSRSALSALESLLFDRCRTHTWIHFHHRVVVQKLMAHILIASLLTQGRISSSSFPLTDRKTLVLRDDIWLWTMLREYKPRNEVESAAKDALLHRKKEGLHLLWRDRNTYEQCARLLGDRLETRELHLDQPSMGRAYENHLRTAIKCHAMVLWPAFRPIDQNKVLIVDPDGSGSPVDLVKESTIVGSLKAIWNAEPQYYVVLLDSGTRKLDTLRTAWAEATAKWLS